MKIKKGIILFLVFVLLFFLVFETYLFISQKQQDQAVSPDSSLKNINEIEKVPAQMTESDSRGITLVYKDITGEYREQILDYDTTNFAWAPKDKNREKVKSLDELMGREDLEFQLIDDNTVIIYY